MGNVTDVSTSGEPDAAVLTRTGTSGVLGGQYLQSRPLAAYLSDDERPQFVLRNKKAGLRIEHAGTRDAGPANGSETGDDQSPTAATPAATTETDHLEPTSEYQALGAVTDVRVVFAVGTDAGDRSASIPLSDIATVGVESGLLSGELTITTAREDRYVFACRGALEPIAEYVDRGAQAWTRAFSLLDAARDHLAAANDHCDAAEFGPAIEEIGAALTAVADARERIRSFGEGAAASFEPETAELRATLERRRREIHVEHGVDAHERARTHWGNRQYEPAHEAYQEAMDALERAQELEETDGIGDRLARIDRELADLAEAPLDYASAMVEEAENSDDPRVGAQCWVVAIERYRDVYALDWAREDERFHGDPVAIRAEIVAALDRLVERRIDATESLEAEAQWCRESGDDEAARAALEEAHERLLETDHLATELSTDDYPGLAAAREAIEAELADSG